MHIYTSLKNKKEKIYKYISKRKNKKKKNYFKA